MSLTKDKVDNFFKVTKLDENENKEIKDDLTETENIKLDFQPILENIPEEETEIVCEDENKNISEKKEMEEKSEEKETISQMTDQELEDLAEDFTKINERQENKKKKIELVIKMFQLLKYDVETISELTNLTIQRDTLLQKEIKNKLMELIPELKLVYKSSYLNCLHDNSIFKQKFPAINLLRQVLKCHHLSLTPKIVSNGYERVTGKKRVNRIFIIQKQMF